MLCEYSKREKITVGLLIGLGIALAVSMIVGFVLLNVYASGKGLKIDLNVDSDYSGQDANIDTYQDGYVVDAGVIFIDQGSWTYEIDYPKGAIDTGEFQVCLRLLNDGTESCGNGYNSKEKHPETVFISFGGNVPTVRDTTDSSASSAASAESSSDNTNTNMNANSQEQKTIIYNCPEGATCEFEQ